MLLLLLLLVHWHAMCRLPSGAVSVVPCCRLLLLLLHLLRLHLLTLRRLLLLLVRRHTVCSLPSRAVPVVLLGAVHRLCLLLRLLLLLLLLLRLIRQLFLGGRRRGGHRVAGLRRHTGGAGGRVILGARWGASRGLLHRLLGLH